MIDDFSSSNSYSLIGVDSNWSYIRFDSPTVPVWVSSNFIEVENEIATVRVNSLNARLRPTLKGAILTTLSVGYSSQVTGTENGFSRIVAPPSTVVAVKKQDLIPQTIAVNKERFDIIESAPPQMAEDEPIYAPKRNMNEREPLGSSEALVVSTDFPSKTASISVDLPNVELETAKREVFPSVESTRHIVVPGDAISLTVFGEGDLSREDLRVSENGEVAFPLLGALSVSGLNTSQIATLVQSRLSKGYVRDPKVSVSMFSYRPIFIRGAVVRTGAFSYAQGLTVGKALALAGGVSPAAIENSVSIERNGKVEIEGLGFDSQYTINSGDVISVDGGNAGRLESAELYIYLHGEVKGPGEYQFRRGLTVEKAVVLAGGFSLRASKRKISITRYVNGQETPVKIRRAELYMPIEPGDVIDVGASWF
ncbi:MAG: polysaccharide biosynthesis/export family protein [Arenicella sp.]|nr:polysaccharide biosynthesis/export family protein [Arenicella sp.]